MAEGVCEVRRAAEFCGTTATRVIVRQARSMLPRGFLRAGEQILVTRKPIGMVPAITQFPIAIPAWKIAPALITAIRWCGSLRAQCRCSTHLAHALTTAGLPPGVLNVLIGGSDVGERIVNHSDVDAITFTGSTGVGRHIASAATARGVPT
ncbi:aldehyde dehydrogenase family protein [Mycolicibacterium goodii]|nr:aldehyde dehydrogenase family protein [Mycolicibacterium goodii]